MFTASKIAIRFLTRSKLQTLIIVLGIAIGVSVQIFIGLLSKGLETSLLDKVAGSFVHITMYSNKDNIDLWQDKIRKIKSLDSSITTVAPVIDYRSFLKLNKSKENIQIRGFIPEDINSLYDMKNKIYEGKMFTNDGQALIGKDLRNKLSLKLGDKINVITSSGKEKELTIVGFYDIGAMKINSVWVITDLKSAQEVSGLDDKITSIEINSRDAFNADIIANKIQSSILGKDLKVENWKAQNKLLASGIAGQKICSIIIEFCVLLATILSIASILSTRVVQKYKQIGILKAIGLDDSSASAIFVLEALILVLIGTTFGIILTMLYIKGFNTYIVTGDRRPLVNIIINKEFIIKSALADIIASIIAAFYPAIKSFVLSPVEVIKNG